MAQKRYVDGGGQTVRVVVERGGGGGFLSGCSAGCGFVFALVAFLAICFACCGFGIEAVNQGGRDRRIIREQMERESRERP